MGYTRLRALTDLHYQPVYAAYGFIITIEELLVENVVDDFHVSFPGARVGSK
jgi:hypothetical protein